MTGNILLAFIPLFVAVDAIGVLPIFVSLTQGLSKKQKSSVVLHSMVTALCVAFGFIFLGKAIFRVLGISIGDFMIAGGAILFCIAIMDVFRPGKERRKPVNGLGAVPLGTPLIAGPAVLTTSMVIVPEYGLAATLIALAANILLAGVFFSFSDHIIRGLGESGTKALSKVMALLLASIAVMLVRKGIMQFLVG